MANNDKRAELKSKVDAAQKRNQERQEQRTLSDYAREARDDATSFIKEHPITTIAGGIALGVLVASIVPGPGRRLRKKATRRGAVLAGVLADLAVNYGSQALDGAGKAARTSQSRLSEIGEAFGEALSDGTRSLRREAGDASDAAGSFTREAGKRATKTLRDLRSRMSN